MRKVKPKRHKSYFQLPYGLQIYELKSAYDRHWMVGAPYGWKFSSGGGPFTRFLIHSKQNTRYIYGIARYE